jgi:hypothetical protein
LEEATSGTLSHLLRKSLEGTLSLVTRGTKVRASHPMTGPRAFHPGSCDHHKKQRSPRQYLRLKNTRSASYSILEPAFQLFLSLLDPGPPRTGHIRPVPRALFHSAISLLLRRFPLLSLLFNCPRNPYCSARARPSI